MAYTEFEREQDIYGVIEEETNYKIQFAMDNFNNIQELIRFIDQKAAAVLVVYGFALTVFVDYARQLNLINPLNLTSLFQTCISIISFLLGLSVSVILIWQIREILLKILLPRLALNYKEDDHSVFYFEHIAHMKKIYLFTRLNEIKQNEIVTEIGGQIFEIAKILNIKMYRMGLIIKRLFLMIIMLLLFIFFNELL